MWYSPDYYEVEMKSQYSMNPSCILTTDSKDTAEETFRRNIGNLSEGEWVRLLRCVKDNHLHNKDNRVIIQVIDYVEK